jgi:membrane fusion protein (multidrug efflux system)
MIDRDHPRRRTPRRSRGPVWLDLRWLGLGLLGSGLTLASLAGCGGEGEAAEASLSGARRREPARVITAPVVQREIVRRLETTTRVESVHEVEVFPQTAGVLTELFVEEGQRVQRGQILARIDQRALEIAREDARSALDVAREAVPTLELAVHEAEARLATAQRSQEQAERDHQRNVAISKSGGDGRPGLLSAKDLDTSLLALEVASGELETARLARERAVLAQAAGDRTIERAELTLAKAELELSYAVITAPFDGVVSSRRVDVGDTLTTSAAAFVLTDTDQLWAVFYRPQRELPLFHSAVANGDGASGGGLELVARADGLPEREFRGWIERVSPTVDAESGNFRVTARVETGAEPHRLLPGMLVRLEIVTDRHPGALVVPKKAIVREGDLSLVFAVREGRAVKLEVEEGFADGDDVEIIVRGDGVLAAGETIVVVGKDLEDGDEVSVPEDEPAEQPVPAEELPAPPPGGDPDAASDQDS